ncbi:unnamed protein product [Symbiodinium microadriaticum]|nr:unnamed protein product [Symbiodinium microadriaticum]
MTGRIGSSNSDGYPDKLNTPLTEPTPDSNRPERATPHQPPAQAVQPRHPDHLPTRGSAATATEGGYPTGGQWQSNQPPHRHGTQDTHPGTDTDMGSAASQQQQQHRSSKRKEGQGPVRTAHRERKEWIKEQFRLHGLHKPNHHTWTQAEDQLMRYLKGRAEHVPGNKPTVQVDIGAVLRSQTEWATTAPARGTKADTAAAEQYAQRADPPYQRQQQQRQQQQATSHDQQQQPKEEPAQQSDKPDKSSDRQQPADDSTKEDRGHPSQQRQQATSRDQQRQPREEPARQHTRSETSSDPPKPTHNTTKDRGHPPRQHQPESNWNVAPAFTWREGDTRLQLYLPPNEGTPLTYPPVLPVGPTMAIVYQSMPAGIWLAASIRQMGHSPPLPPPHDGATVVASKTNPLEQGNQFFLGMGVSIFMRGALKFSAGDQALITKRDGRWKWQLYTYEALQELGGYTHPLPDTHSASSSGATTQRSQREQAASSSSGAQEQGSAQAATATGPQRSQREQAASSSSSAQGQGGAQTTTATGEAEAPPQAQTQPQTPQQPAKAKAPPVQVLNAAARAGHDNTAAAGDESETSWPSEDRVDQPNPMNPEEADHTELWQSRKRGQQRQEPEDASSGHTSSSRRGDEQQQRESLLGPTTTGLWGATTTKPPGNGGEPAGDSMRCATLVALNEMGADVQSEDVAQDLRQIQRLILEGSRQFHTARKARDWAAVHGGENLTERASEVCSNLLGAINSAPPGHPPYVLDAMERLLYLTNEANLLHQQAWGTHGEEERDLATAEEYRPLRKRARHQADVISHGGGPDTQPETLPEPRQELMAMRKLRRLMPFLTGDTQNLASEALQDLCQWSMQFWGDVVFLVESDQEEENQRHPFVNDRQETRRDTRDHKDGYPDKLNKPYKNLEDTHHLQKGLDHYLDQLTEPYNTYQNYHRLRETHEGVPPSQPKNEENPRNYLDLKTEDNEKYQRRRRATRRRPTTLLYQRKDSHLFQEPHGETKTEDNSHRRRQKRNDQGVRRPRDRGTLGHHLDNDLYLNTELYYTTKDYLNYPRRRHSKRRQKRNDQRARRPGDQDDLHKNYDLGDLIQGYQRRRTQRRQRHTTRFEGRTSVGGRPAAGAGGTHGALYSPLVDHALNRGKPHTGPQEQLLSDVRSVMHFVTARGEQIRQLLAAILARRHKQPGDHSIAVETQTTHGGEGGPLLLGG